MRSWQGRIVVAASNSTNNTASGMTQVSQTFYVFNDLPNGLVTIGQFSASSASYIPLPNIPFLTSPQLTKIGFTILSATATRTFNPNVSLILKNIDFTAGTISDIIFNELERFRATVANMPPYNNDVYFGENHFIIRNSSASPLVGYNGVFVESAYQMVGSELIFLRDRYLNSMEFANYRKTWVD